MIIPVTCPDGSSTAEWFLLDLQGRVLPAGSLGAGAQLDGHLMGRLDPAPGGGNGGGGAGSSSGGGGSGSLARFQLQVGTYRMMGSLKPLAKPLLVLRRARPAEAAAGSGVSAAAVQAQDAGMIVDDEAAGEDVGDGDAGASEPPVEYVVHAIIRRRFIFQERPQQMVGSVRQGLTGKDAI